MSVLGLVDDLDVRFGLENLPDAGPHQCLVVGHHDSDHGIAPLRGSVALTKDRPPGWAPASRRPPYRATRSLIPISPLPARGGAIVVRELLIRSCTESLR